MDSQTVTPQFTIRQVLAIRDFRRLWIAQFISMFGDFVALFAVYSMVSFKLNGTARDVSLITLSFLVPLAFIGPVAGVFVDRWDAKRTMIVSDLIRAGLALLLLFATSFWHVYAILMALSTVSSFFLPAQSVTTPLIVPREALLSASAAMQQSMLAVRIVSPAIAGAMVGWLGERSCYILDSVSFIASSVMIGGIYPLMERQPSNLVLGSTVANLLSGTRFILGHRVVGFVILSIAAGTFALACFTALIAVYVRDILHADTYTFGAIGSLLSIGMMAGGTTVGKLARRCARKEYLITAGMFGIGFFVLVIAWTGNRIATLSAASGMGIAAAFIMIPAGALMQSETPHDMRGRVSSSSVSLISISQGIALLFAGDLASRFGIVPLYYGSGAALLAVGLVGLWFLRRSAGAVT